jgi:hypothetical protein
VIKSPNVPDSVTLIRNPLVVVLSPTFSGAEAIKNGKFSTALLLGKDTFMP